MLVLLSTVPPESPRIYDYEGREIIGTLAGPFREGQNVLLSCQAEGGKMMRLGSRKLCIFERDLLEASSLYLLICGGRGQQV